MTLVFLQPVELAEYCFLSEALLWIAVHRVPTQYLAHSGKDARFDYDHNDEYEAHPGNALGYQLELIDELESGYIGLPPSPEFTACTEDNGHYELLQKISRSILDYAHKGNEAKAKLLEKKHEEECERFELECARWRQSYEKFLEIPKSKLFIALAEGKLKAFGRSLQHQDVKKAIEIYEKSLPEGKSWIWQDIPYEEIPKEFWRPDAIKWAESAALDGISHYMHIYIEVESLWELFPPTEEFESKEVTYISGLYILRENSSPSALHFVRSGRPPIGNWDEFHLEITRRLQKDEIPDKQEALIHDMRQWCTEKWGKPPGRSTISQKVSPYYREFIRKKSESS